MIYCKIVDPLSTMFVVKVGTQILKPSLIDNLNRQVLRLLTVSLEGAENVE